MSIVALITPFDDKGEVDFESLENLIRWHIEEGTDGLVLCGTTGEGSLLSTDEKLKVFEKAVEIGKGKIELIATTGTNQTRESILLTQEAKNRGMDKCLVIVPYYLRPTQEGCYRHFAEIAKVGLPLILYHHPGRTGVKLTFETIERICNLPQVIGVKEASGDLQLATQIAKKYPLYSGDDTLASQHFSVGAKGTISITGNVVPRLWKEFVDLALQGNGEEKYRRLLPLCEAMVLETNPQCVKYAMGLLGKCRPDVRLPLIEPQEEVCEIVRAHLQTAELALR